MTDTKKDNYTAVENYERYAYARDGGHRRYVEKATKCKKYFFGEQWDPQLEARLTAQRKPVLTLNKVFSNMLTVSGEQIKISSDISFSPAPSGNDQVAAALTKLWIAIANSNGLRWVRDEVFSSGAITSRGYWDVRIAFDDSLRGEVRIRKENGVNVVLDPDADEYDPAYWNEVFITRWFTPNRLRVLYPDAEDAIAELEARRGSQMHFGYDSIDHVASTFGRQMSMGPTYNEWDKSDPKVRRFIRLIQRQYKDLVTKEHFVDLKTGDMSIVPDTWDRERVKWLIDTYDLTIIKRKVPVIHWCDTADDQVLFNEAMPSYKNFTIVPYFPVFMEGMTIGLVENLLSPQDMLNKTESQELHIVNTTANSGWKIKRGALLNMHPDELEERGAETGLVLELDDINNADKIQPNQVPTGLDRMAYKADEHLKEIGGVSDSMRGFDRADVAAKAIRAKQQAGAINLAVPLHNFTRSEHILAKCVVDLVQMYYTEERVVTYTNGTMNQNTETLIVNQTTPEGNVVNDLTMGEYRVVVTNVPARDNFEDQQFDEAVRLRTEVGIAIPDEVIIKHSHLQDKAEIIDALKGGGDVSPAEQKMAELEVRIKELEAEEAEAVVMKTKADAALAMARTEKETRGDQGTAGEDPEITYALEQEKLDQAHQEHVDKIIEERRQFEETLKFEKQKWEDEKELRRKEAVQKAITERAKVRAAAKAKPKPASAK